MAEAQRKVWSKKHIRKVAVVTGTRAEYGVLKPVLRAIQAHSRLELCLVVSGMHLSCEFGNTVQEIENEGFSIDAKVHMLAKSDTLYGMARSVGTGILGMAREWQRLKPDVVVVLGDRVEPLSAVVAAAYMNVPVGHIHGGDRTKGGLDESARHAVTKLAHIHFPATQTSAQRIISMGEEAWRVHCVGSPALDAILSNEATPSKTLEKEYRLDLSRHLVMVVQHPVTTQVGDAVRQISITLECVAELNCQTLIIYPNSDAGGRRMIGAIQEFERTHATVRVFKSLPRRDYLGLLKMASVLVGNSSSGIIEAPSFGLPVVNVGIRQESRERGANVIDVDHDKAEIRAAVQKALADKTFLAGVKKCENPYGDGKASGRIADILGKVAIGPRLLQKKLAY